MKTALVVLLALHGLIHFLGPARAFGWAEIPELRLAISPAMGLVWLAAGTALLLAALLTAVQAGGWWAVAGGAALLSQVVVVSAWGDARFGTLPNLVIVLAALYGFASQGPWSFRAEYERAVDRRTAEAPPRPTSLLTAAQVDRLPAPVARYLHAAGAVGHPVVESFRARWRGRIRAAPDQPWMPFEAEQYNDRRGPVRYFHMRARRAGLPVDVLHMYEEGTATMRVRLLSLLPLVDAHGPEMDRAETVTVFNDLALLAPSALVGPELRWEPVDGRSARGWFTVGGQTVSALLTVGDDGLLADFRSDDRLAADGDGAFRALPWSTPLSEWHTVDGRRFPGRGDGVWHDAAGPWSYVELELVWVEVEPAGRSPGSGVGP